MTDKFLMHCADKLHSKTRKAYEVEEAKFKTWLKNDERYAPTCYTEDIFVISNVTTEMLIEYIGDFTVFKCKRGKRKEGDLKSVEYIWKVQSAIKYAFDKAKVQLPADYEQLFDGFITGFKNNHADAKQLGNCGSQASDRLTAEGYLQLAKLAITGCDKSFVHCFLIWGWNMFTRCGNTADIKTGNDKF